jgi:bifunctional non-homologous end joining protein LigD
VLDGEVVVLDSQGHPSFARLQARGQIRKARDAERAAVDDPATLFVFDMPGFGEFDLRGLPLLERKALLARVLPKAGALRYSDHVPSRGKELFAQVKSRGLEGLVAKRANAPYRAGRSGDWLKLPAEKTADFVVVGYSRGKGNRGPLGALHVGAWRAGELRYVGRVGTGFNDRLLSELTADLAALERKTPACAGNLPKGPEHIWVEPKMVIEAHFRGWTGDGLVRQVAFKGVREDKPAKEVVRERPKESDSASAPEQTVQSTKIAAGVAKAMVKKSKAAKTKPRPAKAAA